MGIYEKCHLNDFWERKNNLLLKNQFELSRDCILENEIPKISIAMRKLEKKQRIFVF